MTLLYLQFRIVYKFLYGDWFIGYMDLVADWRKPKKRKQESLNLFVVTFFLYECGKHFLFLRLH